jgi:hypothetical protein
MRIQRRQIPRRTPVFIGCEGESERGYGQMLSAILRQNDLPFHLETVCLNPGSGSAIACVDRAIREIQRLERNRTKFSLKVVMIDTDTVDNDPSARAKVDRVALDSGILIIWQSTCHEAFLLRHFHGHAQDAPPTSDLAQSALAKVWPSYRKPMSSMNLVAKIRIENVRRSASVHPDFLKLLQHIKLHN